MRERVAVDVVRAVEEVAYYRIVAPSDKELMLRFPGLSRAAIYRIMRTARERLREAVLKQTSQSIK